MKIKWKENRNLKPQKILNKIKDKINEGNAKIRFDFEYNNALLALESMLEFPDALVDFSERQMIESTISPFNKNPTDVLTKDNFLDGINAVAWENNRIRPKKFKILSSISLNRTLPNRRIDFDSCYIRIFNEPYPKKYIDRDGIILNQQGRKFNTSPVTYKNIIVSVEAKTALGAVERGLKSLNTLRGIWCLLLNPELPYSDSKLGEPINVIRLGECNTIHDSKGKAVSKSLSYELYYREMNTNVVKITPDLFLKNSKWIEKKLNECKYSSELKNAFFLYAMALDEPDNNVALIKLWGAIESITTPGVAQYEKVVNYCSFLFEEKNFWGQIIEHIREYRNQYIHNGKSNDRAKFYCYQLSHIFYHLIIFHLHRVKIFNKLSDANTVLNLPTTIDELNIRKKFIENAIEFLS